MNNHTLFTFFTAVKWFDMASGDFAPSLPEHEIPSSRSDNSNDKLKSG